MFTDTYLHTVWVGAKVQELLSLHVHTYTSMCRIDAMACMLSSFLYMYIHTHIHTHMVCIYVHRAEKQSMPRHMHVKIVLMPFSLRFPSFRLSVQTYVDCAYIYIYIYTWVYVFEAAIRDEKESAEYALRHTKGTRSARSLARSLVSHHFCLSFSSSGVT